MSAGRPLEYKPDVALDATGLSKSSFYQEFNGKHEAFQRALSHYCDTVTSNLRSRLRVGDSSWQFIENMLLGAELSARDLRIRALNGEAVKRVTHQRSNIFFIHCGPRGPIS